MMFFATLKMMLLISLAMMRCLPLCARRHTSLGEAVIIGVANIICRRQTSLKKARSYERAFFWLGHRDSNPGNDGVRVRCLTAWRCPNNKRYYSRLPLFCQGFFEKISNFSPNFFFHRPGVPLFCAFFLCDMYFD